MSDKQKVYDTIFSLVEEELYQRFNASSYKDSTFDGTNQSICGSSNLDIHIDSSLMKGGSKNKSKFKSNKYIPGKFDVLRYSHNVPLNVAIKGTLERQKLFLQEHS
jgi:hypothetical protein